jgi:hypothetical protein
LAGFAWLQWLSTSNFKFHWPGDTYQHQILAGTFINPKKMILLLQEQLYIRNEELGIRNL